MPAELQALFAPSPAQLNAWGNLVMPGVSPAHLFLGLVGALLLSGLMALVYRRVAGPAYAPDVAQAQILLACIMALVMMIVGDSVSRAFGAVGILSVIRFRTNVRDSAEAATLLGSVAVGMACGVGLIGVAVAGALFLAFVQVLMLRVFGAQHAVAGSDAEAEAARGDGGGEGGGKKGKKKNKKGKKGGKSQPLSDDERAAGATQTSPLFAPYP